jgi:hypothetical protein
MFNAKAPSDTWHCERVTVKRREKTMKKMIRLAFVAGAVAAVASALAIAVRAEPANHANRLEATFTEAAQSITNRIADLGTFQLINTGSGTVEGFGSATEVVGITQDRSVSPCGAGSWTNAATRRIVLDDGVLELFELSTACPTQAGTEITGTYEVDGLSSTGVFAGARGSGDVTVDLATHTATLSGRLHLARDGG